jgi:hypothetical protein
VATARAVEEVLSEISGYEATELMKRTEYQRELTMIKSPLAPHLKYAFEFFHPLYNIAEIMTVNGVKTVAGDDSVDIESTTKLEVGQEYILQTVSQQEAVTVKQILSAKRFIAMQPLTISMTGGKLTKTNWTYIDSLGVNGGATMATATTGQVYYSSPIDVSGKHVSDKTKGVIIRVNKDAVEPRLYFRQFGVGDPWTECPWNWRSHANGADHDTKDDIEYNPSIGGSFELKIVAQSETDFDMIMVMTRPSWMQRGDHNPPIAPVIGAPVNEATNVGDQPAFTIAAYTSPTNTPISGVTFELSINETDFTGANLKATLTSNGYSVTPAKGVLQADTTYYVRAKVTDIFSTPSPWSGVTSFTTKAVFASLHVPTCTSPQANEELSSPDSLTLVSSAFAL